MTTEHFTLQSARSAMMTETVGRTTIYLGSLSATLVALALVKQANATEADDFRLFALIVLPAVVFLGMVTFVRLVENSIADTIYVMAINRIRGYYLEMAGAYDRYFVLSGHDDMEGALANMGLTYSRWRPFISIGAVIALINSMVIGALTGIALDIAVSRPISLVAGAAVTIVALAFHYRVGSGRYLNATRRVTPLYPSVPSGEDA